MSTKTKTTETPDLAKLRAAVAEGERAMAVIAEQERARQERNTAALAAAQQEWAVDICTRAPSLDADLADQRKTALADLDAAVERSDLDAALEAWRREAAARFTQRTLNSVWHEAYASCGVGPAPRERGQREHDADVALRFSVALDGAAERSAGNAAAVLGDELLADKPTMPPDELLPPPGSDLHHRDSCPAPRVEVSTVPSGRRSEGKVARCLSCTASMVLSLPEPEPEDELARKIGNDWPGNRPGTPGSWS